MTDKTFNIAGVSVQSGIRKARFANGTIESRTKILERNLHTDINLVALPKSMTKDEAIAYIREQGIEVPDRKIRVRKDATAPVVAKKQNKAPATKAA